MKPISILNDVLGPVMRGPSSSHTAGSYRIGRLARALLGERPLSVRFSFDPGGSYAQVYRQQGSDLGFAAGVMNWSITDERFFQALELAAVQGVKVEFAVERIADATHPNTVKIKMISRSGQQLDAVAQSIGGGAVHFTSLEEWPVRLNGEAHEVLVELAPNIEPQVRKLLIKDGNSKGEPSFYTNLDRGLLHIRRIVPLDDALLTRIETLPDVYRVWTAPPVVFTLQGEPLFSSASEMVALAEARNCSLGQIALAYEVTILGLQEDDVLEEIAKRLEMMRSAVQHGLGKNLPPMQLLRPSARKVYQAEREGRVAIGGPHTRAAARAMAVMHVNGGMGVVCAAPTAGSAGVIPGVVETLAEELSMSPGGAAMALLAASAIGLVVGMRATFAAEVAGCQVEIGASGAMAAAAVVEVAGGSARQATEAAAIALQNSMGSICDPVQGIVEIPCHTRNAVAASSAFVCADLILGGYNNPISLDETVDTVYAVGKMLPRELKCTALGGLAQTPTALSMPLLSF